MTLEPFATLPASDIARARAWYADKLDLKPTQTFEDGSSMYMEGASRFLLYQSEFAGTNKATAAGFVVEGFDATIAELRSRGVEFVDFDLGDGMATTDGVAIDPDGRKGAWFTDSEGNIIAIAEDPRG